MPQGKIIKTASTLYTVRPLEGGEDCLCRPRGRFRKAGTVPLAGDNVLFESRADGMGSLTEILPRRNALVRPPVANVDRLIIVVSEAPPVTSLLMIDSLTALAAFQDIEPVICINKTDLSSGEALKALYAPLGYTVIPVSAADGTGLNELAAKMQGAFCVLTGNSGVGKSSIMNRLYPDFEAQRPHWARQADNAPCGAGRNGRRRFCRRHAGLLQL